MVPASVATLGSLPLSRLRSVVFPHPEGPISARTSPGVAEPVIPFKMSFSMLVLRLFTVTLYLTSVNYSALRNKNRGINNTHKLQLTTNLFISHKAELCPQIRSVRWHIFQSLLGTYVSYLLCKLERHSCL